MRRKEHDEIVTQNYLTTRKGKSLSRGKTLHKRRKSRRPSSHVLLKSTLRKLETV